MREKFGRCNLQVHVLAPCRAGNLEDGESRQANYALLFILAGNVSHTSRHSRIYKDIVLIKREVLVYAWTDLASSITIIGRGIRDDVP